MSVEFHFAKAPEFPEEGCIVFSIVRNERRRLPAFLKHYRGLGVAGFLFLDDHSSDGTLEYLAGQPDCNVTRSSLRFGDDWNGRRFGPQCKTLIPSHLCENRWVLTADADELLVLPPPFASLSGLIAALEENGLQAMRAVMLDFYPERLGAIEGEEMPASPFDFARHFDQFDKFVWPDGHARPLAVSFINGVRPRMFLELLRRDPMLKSEFAHYRFASIHKVPLVYWKKGVQMFGAHSGTVHVSEQIQAVLAHFKLFPDLKDKVQDALASGAYWQGSVEYRFLEKSLMELGDWSLLDRNTRLFIGPESLESAGWLFSRLE